MGIQVTRTGTNWTVDVTTLDLVNDTAEQDFIVVINKVEQPLTAYVKTTATVITYSGAALPANTVIDFYRWGLRDVDPLEYGEVTSQLGMNRRLTQIERVLDDLREVKQFIWSGVDGTAAVATHVSLADPHTQYRLKSAAIPEIATAITAHETAADPHPTYTTAAELLTALTGYLPTSQRGAVNGIAPLDGSSKVPAVNSRGCNASYAGATGVWTFTWADGATQTVDTPLELVFQSVNYNTTTKQVTFTLVGGATTSFSLADLVDLPELQVAVTDPVATPTTGQRMYLRSDNGNYWVSNGTAWVGPYLPFTAAERSKLAGIAAGAQVNTVTSVAGKTGAVTLVKGDVGLGAVDNTADVDKPVSSAVQSAINECQPIDSDLTAIAALTDSGLVRRTGTGTADTVAPSASGLTVLTGDPAAGRSAIDAEVSFTSGAILRATLTGSGLERRASDGSVWLNGKLKQAPATLSQRALSQRGLVLNGTCEIPAVADAGGILRAEGWSAFGVDTSNKIAGKYTIRRNTICVGDGTDDFFSLSPGVTYGFYSNVYGGESPPAGANYSLALSCWDGEPTPQPVNTYTHQYIANTAASLSRPLNVGDRQIFIAKSGVTPGGYGGVYCYFTLYGAAGYVSPSGTQYKAPQSNSPLGFYSQWNSPIGFATPATITDLGTEYRIDIAADQPGWTIPNPAGGTWPAGTLCGATQGGDGNFFYPGPTAYRNFIPGAYDVIRPSRPPEPDSVQFKLAVYGTVPTTIAKNLPPGTTTLKVTLYLLNATDMRFQVNLYEV